MKALVMVKDTDCAKCALRETCESDDNTNIEEIDTLMEPKPFFCRYVVIDIPDNPYLQEAMNDTE